MLLESLYADDFAGGAYDEVVAIRIQRTAKDPMHKDGFCLKKGYSKSSHVQASIATNTSPNSAEGITELFASANLGDIFLSNCSKTRSTNLPELSASFPLSPNQRTTAPVGYVKLLGINWNLKTD